MYVARGNVDWLGIGRAQGKFHDIDNMKISLVECKV